MLTLSFGLPDVILDFILPFANIAADMTHVGTSCLGQLALTLRGTRLMCLQPHAHPPGPSQLCSSGGSFQQPGWLVYGVKGYWRLSNTSEGGHLLQWFLEVVPLLVY